MRVKFENENAKITKFELTMHPDFQDNPTVFIIFQTNRGSIQQHIPLCDITTDPETNQLLYVHDENRDFVIKLMFILDVRSIDKIVGSYCRITTNEYGRLLTIRNIIFDEDKVDLYE